MNINLDNQMARYQLEVYYVTEGSSHCHWEAENNSKEDILMAAARMVGWLQARDCTVVKINLYDRESGVYLAIPGSLERLY